MRLLTTCVLNVEGKNALVIMGTFFVALVFDNVNSILPPVRHTDTSPWSHNWPFLIAVYVSPFFPSLMEMIRGKLSLAVVSFHRVCICFATSSLTELRHPFWANADLPRANMQTSDVRKLFAIHLDAQQVLSFIVTPL
jgi:hypothetical protein